MFLCRVRVFLTHTLEDGSRFLWLVGIVVGNIDSEGNVIIIPEKAMCPRGKELEKVEEEMFLKVSAQDCEVSDRLIDEEVLTHCFSHIRRSFNKKPPDTTLGVLTIRSSVT